jgi:hypothetical protein
VRDPIIRRASDLDILSRQRRISLSFNILAGHLREGRKFTLCERFALKADTRCPPCSDPPLTYRRYSNFGADCLVRGHLRCLALWAFDRCSCTTYLFRKGQLFFLFSNSTIVLLNIPTEKLEVRVFSKLDVVRRGFLTSDSAGPMKNRCIEERNII